MEKAQAEAKSTGRKVVIPSLHTETSTTYANTDGKTLVTELHTDLIRVKQGDAWQPVDTTLVVDGGVIRPRSTKSQLVLSSGGGDQLLSMAGEKAGSEFKLRAGKKLPVPRLSGNRAQYADAYGPGIDLVVTATSTGFRQEIVIRQRPTQPLRLKVPVELPAKLSYKKNGNGGLVLRDSTGRDAKNDKPLPTPYMVDAGVNLAIGEEGRVGKVATTLEKDGDREVVVLNPDQDFLSDSAVTYPVTLMSASTDWTELPVGNDTFINNSSYQNGYANSGAYHLQAGKTNDGTVTWRTYIRFDEIPEDSPLRGGRVKNADLILWNISSNDCGDVVGSGITARRVTQRWDVSTLTWSNQPRVTSTGSDNEPGAYLPGCSRGYMDYEWDLYHYVNDIVQEWANGEPNYGFQLTSGSEGERTNWRAYRSNEWGENFDGSHGPKLVIGYEPAITEATVYWGLPRDAPITSDTLADYRSNLTDSPLPPAAVTPEQAAATAQAEGTISEADLANLRDPEGMSPEQATAEVDPNMPPYDTPPEAAIAGEWHFDEGTGRTAADASENAYDAMLNETTAWTAGKNGKAVTNLPPASPQVRKSTGLLDAHLNGTSTTAAPPAAVEAATAVSGLTVDPSQVVNGTVVTSSLTPTLKATVTESAGSASNVEFQVARYSDDVVVWSGSAANVASGSQASVKVGTGVLIDGIR
ncbi:DNRLRE domain-containing protein [Nonomuraea candida]|uniref:DNRLRE domain-containing protein n=1 Tax=Nonomuraea candida TaxID=359159 RepID=UPI00146FD6F0|nr:DNRLRE domain-containing protein [Nonomuraea candida]